VVFNCAGCKEVKSGKTHKVPTIIRLVTYPGRVSGYRINRMPTTPWGQKVRAMQRPGYNSAPLGFEIVREESFCGSCISIPPPQILNSNNPKIVRE